jgi:hypothetical protein
MSSCSFKEWFEKQSDIVYPGGWNSDDLLSAYRAGQAEMRERAAMETWEWDDRDEIRKEIRALPLEGDDE